MRLFAGHQPHYLPSIQYFAKIALCEEFVFSDDVQYEPKEWQNRNRVPGNGPDGWQWLSAPVRREGFFITEKILAEGNWQMAHVRTLENLYRKQPGWEMVEELCSIILASMTGESLDDLNISLTRSILKMLNIRTACHRAVELVNRAPAIPNPSQKLAGQMEELHCEGYLSGMSGPEYMDTSYFQPGSLFLFRWVPCGYGAPMDNLSIVDLIARKGIDAWKFLGARKAELWV